MKKIINGKVYDTDTAKELGSWANAGSWRDFTHLEEELYQKRTGEFFLHGEGGPMTKYAVSMGQNSWSGGEKIIPLSAESARKWAEEHLDADDYEAIFGTPEEIEGERSTLCVQLPTSMVAQIKRGAVERGISMTAYLEELLRSVL